MRDKRDSTYLFILLLIFFIGGYIALIYILKMLGYIVFINRFSLFQEYIGHLGNSVYWFAGNLLLFSGCCVRLLWIIGSDENEYITVRFYDSLANLSISLFFGIGVIYTAVGMQQAFQLSLGNVEQDMIQKLGPWGILQSLVEGGLLMALLTTIVGGALGYILRLVKFFLFGKKLFCIIDKMSNKKNDEIIEKLSSIENKLTVIAGQADNRHE